MPKSGSGRRGSAGISARPQPTARSTKPTHPDFLRAQLLVAWHERDQVTERYILRLLLDQFGPEATATSVR